MERFILTKELGRLAKWLRILGYDAQYFIEDNRSKLIITALREDRIILTRNRRMAEPIGMRSINIKDDSVKKQIRQVIKELKLKLGKDVMFSRCTICNEPLEFIDKKKVKTKVPEYVFKTQDRFFRCMNCQRVYWQGTHWGNAETLISQIKSQISADKNP
ncbi:MAG: Mut7-C RNAse domain-containing protein [Candidatus Omnitrophica bacterium]|nr:Mut7-C RNAse domain-containing protein [Candidatus Omnitrophota bacterium]